MAYRFLHIGDSIFKYQQLGGMGYRIGKYHHCWRQVFKIVANMVSVTCKYLNSFQIRNIFMKQININTGNEVPVRKSLNMHW